jgi:hypothetical protein
MLNIFKSVIARGGYNLSALLKKLDIYHVEGKLTDSERDELRAYAINNADIKKHPEYAAIVDEVKNQLGIVEEEAE